MKRYFFFRRFVSKIETPGRAKADGGDVRVRSKPFLIVMVPIHASFAIAIEIQYVGIIMRATEPLEDWIEAESLEYSTGGLLYLIDGHVRVYHGSQTKLPKHHVARQRLCLRPTTDYRVNQSGGTPVFKINQTVDPGIIEVLRTQIIPRLQKEIPNQPTPEQLQADSHLPRFTLIFDREGYSPALFKELWQDKHIACQTYRKGNYQCWPAEEFKSSQVRLKNGQTVSWKLAERSLLLGSKKKMKAPGFAKSESSAGAGIRPPS